MIPRLISSIKCSPNVFFASSTVDERLQCPLQNNPSQSRLLSLEMFTFAFEPFSILFFVVLYSLHSTSPSRQSSVSKLSFFLHSQPKPLSEEKTESKKAAFFGADVAVDIASCFSEKCEGRKLPPSHAAQP